MAFADVDRIRAEMEEAAGPPAPAALRPRVLPGGVRAARRSARRARTGPLRDHAASRRCSASATARSAAARRSLTRYERVTFDKAARASRRRSRSPSSSRPATRCSTRRSTSSSSGTAHLLAPGRRARRRRPTTATRARGAGDARARDRRRPPDRRPRRTPWSAAASSSSRSPRRRRRARAGYAPYLDYRPPTDDERPASPRPCVDQRGAATRRRSARPRPTPSRSPSPSTWRRAPAHRAPGRRHPRRGHERLTREINYWDHRANELAAPGRRRRSTRINLDRCRSAPTSSPHRLEAPHRRARPPNAASRPAADGGRRRARRSRRRSSTPSTGREPASPADVRGSRRGRTPGRSTPCSPPRSASAGMPATSTPSSATTPATTSPRSARATRRAIEMRFIEVKGRVAGADTVTVSRNEILTALNEPDRFVLALVEVRPDGRPTRCATATPSSITVPWRRRARLFGSRPASTVDWDDMLGTRAGAGHGCSNRADCGA